MFSLLPNSALATPEITVTAHQTTQNISLDGRLDETAWKQAGRINDLTQQNPNPGQPTPYRTEILFLVDQGGITLGFICNDPQPDAISVHTMARDGNLDGDDSIAFVLDTFGDRRRGYYFQINAAGARVDGLITGPEDVSLDWDGIWDAATAHTARGWTAEIHIPAQTLRFPTGVNGWGLNLERVVARDRLTLRWADSSRNAMLSDLRRAGGLTGVSILKQGLGISISPYGIVHADKDENTPDRTTTGDFGGDATWNLTSELSAVVTFNTDFAETEVDARQINLTRFPLFFPEKRAFFLEGSDQFDFGSGLGRDFVPFFSRRIGLYDGEQVPLDVGGKILGRSGRWGIGLLGARTGSSEVTNEANLYVGRITYDVNSNLTVGTIATDGDPDGISDNSLLGFDAIWQTSTLGGDKNFSVGSWVADSKGDVPDGRSDGWGLKIDYPNDLWDVALIYRELGDGLDPALGFLPRPGTQWFKGGVSYQPRPSGGMFDWVRQFFFELYSRVVKDLDGKTQSWRIFTAPFNAETESGEHIEANYVPQYEWLSEPFEISDGVIIPSGDFRFDRFRIEVETSQHRAVVISSSVWFGEFYTGTLTQWETEIGFASGDGRLQLSLAAENDFAELPEGSFIQRLYQLRVEYAFNPKLILSTDTQYDSESRDVGVNARFRWTIQPGNDLYIVWSSALKRPWSPDDWGLLHNTEDHLAVKLQWTLRY